jgi:hypothetical protein
MTDSEAIKQIDNAITCFPPMVLSRIIHNYAKPVHLRFNMDEIFWSNGMTNGTTNVLGKTLPEIVRKHLRLTPTGVFVTSYSGPWLFVVSTLTLDQIQDSFSIVLKGNICSFDFIIGCCQMNEPGKCHVMSYTYTTVTKDCTLQISKTDDKNNLRICGMTSEFLFHNASGGPEWNYSNTYFCIGLGYYPQSVEVVD